MQVALDILLFVRFNKIDPSDPKIIKLHDNFVREEKNSFIDHNWSICCLYANCCYPHDDREGPPSVGEEMMFCTICKAEVILHRMKD